MSVESVSLQSERYEYDGEGYVGEKVFRVVMTDPANDDAVTAYSANDGTTAIPDIGDEFKAGSAAKAKSKSASRVSEGLAYDVTVSYSSKSRDYPQTVENPKTRPWEYSYDDQTISEQFFFDETDETPLPMANSAGEPFDTLPEREVTIGQLTITRNTDSFSDSTAQSYRGKVNDAAVTINGVTYLAGTLRLRTWSARGPLVENGFTYWQEVITLAKRADGFDQKWEDRGYSELSSGKLIPIRNEAGDQVVKAWPLNGAGAKKPNATDTPAVLTRKPYATADLSFLADA